MKLFVYGTLMQKFTASAASTMLKNAESVFICEASVKGNIYDVGYFPAFVLGGEEREVKGELWEIDPLILPRLDGYEGYNDAWEDSSFYIRRSIDVKMVDGRIVEAQIYIFNEEIKGLPLVESGDYFEYKN